MPEDTVNFGDAIKMRTSQVSSINNSIAVFVHEHLNNSTSKAKDAPSQTNGNNMLIQNNSQKGVQSNNFSSINSHFNKHYLH